MTERLHRQLWPQISCLGWGCGLQKDPIAVTASSFQGAEGEASASEIQTAGQQSQVPPEIALASFTVYQAGACGRMSRRNFLQYEQSQEQEEERTGFDL